MSQQLVGQVDVVVDGETLRSMPGATCMMGGVERAAVVGNVLHGYTEQTVPAEVNCTIAVRKGDSLSKWRAVTDATVIFLADTGLTLTMPHAFLAEPPTLTGGEGGQVALKFIGETADEGTE